MANYFIKAQTKMWDGWSDDISRPSSLDVPDHVATDTGILDARGNPIFRAPNPMGFCWDAKEKG